jgi:hypothetical protein
MRSSWLTRTIRTTLAVGLLVAVTGVSLAWAKPGPERGARRRGFNLFAVTNAVLDVNRVFCGINNLGELCVDPTNSPVVGGGFWPKGTPDQYVFNSGLQLAGIIPTSAGFPWAGDTVGAYFMDPRGTQSQGDGVTLVYNSLDQGDAAAWPNGAVVRDAAIFNSILLGRSDVSQQDLWVRSWEGNPAFLSGRTHPMGILVEERGMAWNFPTGNEDIVYFVFTFYNVTARNCSAYANATIPAAVQAEVCAIGQDFQNRNELRFGIAIPDGGYPIDNLFAAFFADMDVGDAGLNYSTAVLPFNMAVAYKSNFLEPNWSFPPEIFGAPFVPSPGFVGVKYLKSPTDALGDEIGLTMFSNTRNAATGFPDAVGVIQLWRYLSGNVNPAAGDLPCTFQGEQIARKLCFLDQQAADTRFLMSSGPFLLPPGEGRTIVVAYIHAAPTADVVPFIGGDLPPGIPLSGDSFAAAGACILPANPGCASIRTIERATGWQTHADTNGNGTIDQFEVGSPQRSLLDKALVAQAVFDAGFLLPFAPTPPGFFLVPGDEEVTIVWQTSSTESAGDPFFAVASDNTSPLYDPNFREFDVEGYRIYRGRTTSQLALIAQFDYVGTEIVDFTGSFAYTVDENENGLSECAPELGVTADCPSFPEAHALVGDVIQIPAGGRVELADGSVLIVRADTVGTGFPDLSDNGVAFAYTDDNVRNGFTYFYSVTAFDVNSLRSGPSSLESPRITKAVRPRRGSGQEVAGQLGAQAYIAGNGSPITDAVEPTINATTGIFSKRALPADGISAGLAAFLPQVLADGNVTVRIDSVLPGAGDPGTNGVTVGPATYYVTAQGAGSPVSFTVPLQIDGFDEDRSSTGVFPATAIDATKSGRYGGDATYALYGSVGLTSAGTWRLTNWGRGEANAAPANSSFNGPRWYDGSLANENTSDPNIDRCSPAVGTCVRSPLTKNAGALTGVTTIFHVSGYSTIPSVPARSMEPLLATVARAADFRVRWGAAGVIDSVFDLTHGVPVPFDARIGATWGLLTDQSWAGVTAAPDNNNALLTWSDLYCVPPARGRVRNEGLGAFFCTAPGSGDAQFQSTATLSPIAAASATFANTGSQAATGNGFIFYIAGQYFLMQMPALPAAGTIWNLRTYSGVITGTTGSYAFTPTVRPPAVPGMRVRISYTGSTLNMAATTDSLLNLVHTLPDPYYVTNALEISSGTKVLQFVNLPGRAIVRIYSVSGVLVRVLTNNDATGGGTVGWDLRNRNNQVVASGVYFYHVETPDGRSKVGRFTVVNFAQ